MAEKKKSKTQGNEGEGNRTAARLYNKAQMENPRSGKYEKKAQ